RVEATSAARVEAQARTLLGDGALGERVRALAPQLARHRPVAVLGDAIDALLAKRDRAPRPLASRAAVAV
ncbi:MAG: hypothetical protein JO090_01575, partial [Rhizobacter sp.]|nr:hypothetical protein [Rhizobacter sp.]